MKAECAHDLNLPNSTMIVVDGYKQTRAFCEVCGKHWHLVHAEPKKEKQT